MKISGSSSNNINFIEQKSATSTPQKVSENKEKSSSDTFSSSSQNTIDFFGFSNSIGMIDTLSNSLKTLQSKSKDLQDISKEFAISNSKEYQVEFEMKLEEMMSVIDSTIYENIQLFYSPIALSNEQSTTDFMLSEIISLDDLSVTDRDEIELLGKKLQNFEKQFANEKNYFEQVSFNSLAALSATVDISFESLHVKEEMRLNVKDIQGAHNANSLSENISALLAD